MSIRHLYTMQYKNIYDCRHIHYCIIKIYNRQHLFIILCSIQDKKCYPRRTSKLLLLNIEMALKFIRKSSFTLFCVVGNCRIEKFAQKQKTQNIQCQFTTIVLLVIES